MITLITNKFDLGQCYINECTSCKETSTFSLVQTVDLVKLLSFTLNKKDSYDLICCNCNKEFKVTDNEIDAFKELAKVFNSLSNEEKYIKCSSLELKSLIKEKVYLNPNTCNNCQEDSPGNMSICWNCGEEIEGAITEDNCEYDFIIDPVFGTKMIKRDE